jgi:hypothetical protein
MSRVQHSRHAGLHERALAAGYSHNQLPVVPPDAKTSLVSPGKTPGVRSKGGTWSGFLDWQKEQETTPQQAGLYDSWGAGLGFLGGVNGLLGLDLDITEPTLLAAVKSFFYGLLPLDQWGTIPERGVDHPEHIKTLLMMRVVDETGTPIPLPSSYDVGFRLADGTPNLVQLIATGRYFNAYGTHPDRKAPYVWSLDVLDLGLDNLPKVEISTIKAFLAGLPEILLAHGASIGSTSTPTQIHRGSKAPPMPNAQLLEILDHVPNSHLLFDHYDKWIDFGQNLKGAAREPNDPALAERFVTWCQARTGPFGGGPSKDPLDTWNSFEPERAHAGSFRNLVAHIMRHPKPDDPDFRQKEIWACDFDAYNLVHPIEPEPPAFTTVEPKSGTPRTFNQLVNELGKLCPSDPDYN